MRRPVNETLSSKARPRVQWGRRALLAAAVAGAGFMAGAGDMPGGRPTPTGLEVPRWISLKSSQTRARFGPGLDHRILWEYQVRGLPVQVIAETREWRKICDPEGNVAWIHRTVASGRRTVFNPSEAERPIHVRPSATAPVRARLSPRSLVALETCRDGWCRVRARRIQGWVAEADLFGTQSQPLCDAARPAGAAPRRADADGG